MAQTTHGYWYVDTAAVRIQTWLARSAALRYRRGASFGLADRSGPEHITRLLTETKRTLPAGTEWNPEAGAISGVVPIRFPADGLDEQAAREGARAIATLVAGHLRKAFPSLPIKATWGRGQFYVNAYAGDMHKREISEGPLLDLPTQPDEGIVSRPCGMCRSARAVKTVTIIADEGPLDLCVDCSSRVAGAGYSSAHGRKRLPEAQQRLDDSLTEHAKAMTEHTDTIRRYPEDFAALARAIGRDDGDSETQLATIFADGNQIGALLKRLAQQAREDETPFDKSEVAAKITKATREALADSALACQEAARRIRDETRADLSKAETEDKTYVPMLVHVADGDDILFSVPAPLGWVAARTLAASFEKVFGAMETSRDDQQKVSVSMGMVFHHSSHPIADVVEKADELLGDAKKETRGSEAAVAFLDLTSDGENSAGQREHSPTAQRKPWRIADLEANEAPAGFDKLAMVDSSHRVTLLHLLRDSALAAYRAQDDPGTKAETEAKRARDEVQRRVEKLSDPGILAFVSDRTALGAAPPGAREDLRRALDVARWWTPTPPKPTPAGKE